MTFSAGFSTRMAGCAPADVLLSADHAVYVAKRAGRDQDVYELTLSSAASA